MFLESSCDTGILQEKKRYFHNVYHSTSTGITWCAMGVVYTYSSPGAGKSPWRAVIQSTQSVATWTAGVGH